MVTKSSPLHLLLMILICLAAWTGLLLQFITLTRNLSGEGKTLLDSIIRFFSFFTVTTNTIVAVTTTLALLFPQTKVGQWCVKPSTITATTVYIVVVGLVYNLVLRPLSQLHGIDAVGNELVHSLVPLLYVVYWILFDAKGNISYASSIRWLLYPFLYLCYTFLHGLITNWFPYPFMNATQIGYERFWLNAFYLLLLFLFLNIVLISIDKGLSRAKKNL